MKMFGAATACALVLALGLAHVAPTDAWGGRTLLQTCNLPADGACPASLAAGGSCYTISCSATGHATLTVTCPYSNFILTDSSSGTETFVARLNSGSPTATIECGKTYTAYVKQADNNANANAQYGTWPLAQLTSVALKTNTKTCPSTTTKAQCGTTTCPNNAQLFTTPCNLATECAWCKIATFTPPCSASQGAGGVCNAASGQCDIDDVYTTGCACPAQYAPLGTSCSGSDNSGPCIDDDTCDGQGQCVDNYLLTGAHCTGASQGGPCNNDAGDHCNAAHQCVDAFNVGAPCVGSDNSGPCIDDDTCNDQGQCVDNYLLTGAHCIGASQGGACDDDTHDSCNAAHECVDAYVAENDPCTGTKQGGPCNDDGSDYCNAAHECVDVFNEGAPCDGADNVGPCVDQDTCDANGVCQDNYKPDTYECRPAVGACDAPETCSGNSAGCGPDICLAEKEKGCGKCFCPNKKSCEDGEKVPGYDCQWDAVEGCSRVIAAEDA